MTPDQIIAAHNIAFSLIGVGVDQDLAIHQGFQLVGKFVHADDYEECYKECAEPFANHMDAIENSYKNSVYRSAG